VLAAQLQPRKQETTMKFTPLESMGRVMPGARLGYSVRNSGAGSVVLAVSVHPELVRKLGWRADMWLRLDADREAGVGRLLPVNGYGRAARKMKLSSGGRGSWRIPFNGAIPEVFPRVDHITELVVADVTQADGLLFELPAVAKKKGGAR
jgi:hypothetical protein